MQPLVDEMTANGQDPATLPSTDPTDERSQHIWIKIYAVTMLVSE